MKNFDAEVLGPRRQAAAACSAVLSVGWLAAAVTVAALSTSPLQPLAAAREVVATLTSLSSLPTVLLYAGLVVWSSLHHSTPFVTTPTVIKAWASVVYKVCCSSFWFVGFGVLCFSFEKIWLINFWKTLSFWSLVPMF